MRAWLIKEVELNPVNFEETKKYLGLGDHDLIELVTIPVRLRNGETLDWHMAMDEEGKLKNLSINPVATGLFWGNDQIVGDVLLLEGQFD